MYMHIYVCERKNKILLVGQSEGITGGKRGKENARE
jgi:hypothetical protein